MRQQAKLNKEDPPYLFQYYNVQGFMQERESMGIRRAIARMVNATIKALNLQVRLPRFLVLAPDKDIVDDIDQFDEETPDLIRANLNWLIRQINMVVTRRKTELADKKPGAIYSSDPKVIYIKMTRCPMQFKDGSRMDKIISTRSTFNKILCELLAEHDQRILGVKTCASTDCYDLFGEFNQRGKSYYWREVNDLIEKFDKKKIQLLPRI